MQRRIPCVRLEQLLFSTRLKWCAHSTTAVTLRRQSIVRRVRQTMLLLTSDQTSSNIKQLFRNWTIPMSLRLRAARFSLILILWQIRLSEIGFRPKTHFTATLGHHLSSEQEVGSTHADDFLLYNDRDLISGGISLTENAWGFRSGGPRFIIILM